MKEFSVKVRVYYEDTDVAGVVYYVNYLKFMERARTEWLRHLGFDQVKLSADPGVIFAVRSAYVDYLRPARLDDLLEATLSVTRSGSASITFAQEIRRDDVVLCRGEVKIASLNAASFSLMAVPDEIGAAVESWRNN